MADLPIPGRCGYFVKRKKRHCKMLPSKGNTYCAEHLHLQEHQEDNQNTKRRVPCPLDPKHTVFEARLKTHLKKCNALLKTQHVYFEEHINSGIRDYEFTDAEKTSLNSAPPKELFNLIERIQKCYKDLHLEIKESFELHNVLQEEIDKPENGQNAKKHLIQKASLLHIFDTNNALRENITFIEFGAGKGKLSHWLQYSIGNSPNVDYFLVDRQSSRHKSDSYHKGEDQGPSFQRLNIDIKDLNLAKVDAITQSTKSIVGIGKHLCGSATDLALRCLMETLPFNDLQDEIQDKMSSARKKPKLSKYSNRVKVALFALCCYHRCTWPTYVGRDFFVNHGFNSIDFHRITGLAAWATCGFPDAHHDKPMNDKHKEYNDTTKEQSECGELEDMSEIDSKQKEDIGRQCKRLIDYGRLKYLHNYGFDTHLLYYVKSNITLENVALLATIQSPEKS